MSDIIAPARHLTGDVAILVVMWATMAAAAMMAAAEPGRRRTAWTALTFLLGCAAALTTPRPLLLLPATLALTLLSAPSGTRRSRPWTCPHVVATAAVIVGRLAARWIDGDVATATEAALLRPFLGERWWANGLWLAMVSSAATAWWWSRATGAYRRPIGRQAGVGPSLRGAAWLVALTTTAATLVVSLGHAGQPFLAHHLLWQTATMLAAALAVTAITGGRRRSLLLLAPAAAALAASWSLATPPRINPAVIGASLAPALHHLGPADLLLVRPSDLRHQGFRVPFDLAGEGRVATSPDLDLAGVRLDGPGLLRDFASVLVIGRDDPAQPWLGAVAGADRRPVKLGKAGSDLVLLRLDAAALPGPVVLLDTRRAGPHAGVRGLHDDGVWTTDTLAVTFTPVRTGPAELRMTLRNWRPAAAGPVADGLSATLNGTALAPRLSQRTYFAWDVPEGVLEPGANLLEIRAPVFVPADLPGDNADTRRLGLDLETIILH